MKALRDNRVNIILQCHLKQNHLSSTSVEMLSCNSGRPSRSRRLKPWSPVPAAAHQTHTYTACGLPTKVPLRYLVPLHSIHNTRQFFEQWRTVYSSHQRPNSIIYNKFKHLPDAGHMKVAAPASWPALASSTAHEPASSLAEALA